MGWFGPDFKNPTVDTVATEIRIERFKYYLAKDYRIVVLILEGRSL